MFSDSSVFLCLLVCLYLLINGHGMVVCMRFYWLLSIYCFIGCDCLGMHYALVADWLFNMCFSGSIDLYCCYWFGIVCLRVICWLLIGCCICRSSVLIYVSLFVGMLLFVC